MYKTLNKIVFYDGDCGLCNRSVQFILRYEKNTEINFCTLQSEYSAKYFKERGEGQPDLSTFFYAENGVLHQKSDAAFCTARNLRFPYSAVRIFSILPQWLTDQVYNLIAKYRKKIGGNFCVVPTLEQKKRFVN